MFYISKVATSAPSTFKSQLQHEVYALLDRLHINYERVDTDEAITMDDCIAIDAALDMKMVKTLFLCNRQKTQFYIFVTTADKPFSSKDFSHALGISRVSFAPAELLLSMLGSPVGAATALSVVSAPDNVEYVFDKDVLSQSTYGCSDGTNTCYMKLHIDDVFNLFKAAGRDWKVVEL